MTTPLAEHAVLVRGGEPVAEHTFRVETKDGYGIPAELVVFEVDTAGRVTRAKFGENYTQRIESWEDR